MGDLRRFGYSKEKRNDCTQVILGLMLDQGGLSVGYKLFPGNTYEGKTLPVMLHLLKEEYGIKRLIFVADRGMINTGNLDILSAKGFEFIIGMKLWAMKEAEQKQIVRAIPVKIRNQTVWVRTKIEGMAAKTRRGLKTPPS